MCCEFASCCPLQALNWQCSENSLIRMRAAFTYQLGVGSELCSVTSVPSVMHFQEWLQSLRSSAGLKGSESENLWSLLPSLPSFSLSSLTLSPSSLLGLGALASLTAYWLVTRPRPMRPPCDLQAQSVAVNVSGATAAVAISVFVEMACWWRGLLVGRSQLQALRSSERWFAAGVLLRWHQDVLRHVPERPEDRRWRQGTLSTQFIKSHPKFYVRLRCCFSVSVLTTLSNTTKLSSRVDARWECAK